MTIVKEQATDTTCEGNGCCSSTSDGAAICELPQNWPMSGEVIPLKAVSGDKNTWQQIRGGVMFGIACIASPCCTPLIVPLIITLLAGTPVAIWMTHNQGLIYGGLTILSVVSFILALRWISNRSMFAEIRTVIESLLTRKEASSS